VLLVSASEMPRMSVSPSRRWTASTRNGAPPACAEVREQQARLALASLVKPVMSWQGGRGVLAARWYAGTVGPTTAPEALRTST